jgi:branched-chain amino acid transport system substrate-binding protein
MGGIMKRRVLSVAIFVFLFLLSGCRPAAKVIAIGVAGPMTGAEGKMGQDILNGARMAVEAWNAKGGVLGKQIEIIAGDDRSDPKEAVAVANKFVNEQVVAAVGNFNSSCTIPASRVFHDSMIPHITPAATNPKLTQQGFANVFRVCGTDDQQGKAEAEFVAHELKAERVAIIHDKTTYGQGLADFFKSNLPSQSQVVAYEGIVKGDKDFSAVLTKIKTFNPQVIMFGGIYPEGGLLIKQMRDLGLSAGFISGDGTIDPEFIHIGGQASEGAYLSFAMIGPTGEVANLANPKAMEFINAYRARFGALGPYSIYAYDATNIILESIAKSGMTEGVKLSAAIHQGSFNGAVGTIEFDDKGDVKNAPYIIWVVKGGKFTPYSAAKPQ